MIKKLELISFELLDDAIEKIQSIDKRLKALIEKENDNEIY